MNSAHIQPFDCNSSNLSNEWTKWKLSLDICLKAYEVVDPELKQNWLLHLGGSDLIDIFSSVADPEYGNEDDAYVKAIKKLDSHFAPKKQKRFERHLLRKIKQEQNELFETFVIRIKKQAANCEFGAFSEDAIIDQIIEGCTSKELKNKSLTQEMDLHKIIQTGLSLETVEKQLRSFQGEYSGQINKINVQHRKSYEKKECFSCGKSWFLGHRQKCEALNHKCKNCNKMGHFEKKCYSKKRSLDEGDQQQNKRQKSEKVWSVEKDDADEVKDKIFCIDGDEVLEFNLGKGLDFY